MKRFNDYITEETQTAEKKYYTEDVYLEIAKKISIVYKKTETTEKVDYLSGIWDKYKSHFSETYKSVEDFKNAMKNDDKIYDLWIYCKSQNKETPQDFKIFYKNVTGKDIDGNKIKQIEGNKQKQIGNNQQSVQKTPQQSGTTVKNL